MSTRMLFALVLAFGAFMLVSGCNEGSSATGCTDDIYCLERGYDYCGPDGVCMDKVDGDTEITDEFCDTDEQCVEKLGPGWECKYSISIGASVCQKIPADGDCDSEDCAADGDYEEKDPPYIPPRILIKPAELNFGAVAMNTSAERSFTITNDSNFDTDLVIDLIRYDNITQTEEFSIKSAPETKLVLKQGEESDPITVEYVSLDPGTDQAVITVVSNAGDANDMSDSIINVNLYTEYKGTKRACVDQINIDFDNVDLGGEPKFQDITITNCGLEDGNKILTVSEIVWANFSENFTITEGLVNSISPIYLPPTPGVDIGQHVFTIKYQPQTKADGFSPHKARIFVMTDSEEPDERIIEINMQGIARSKLIETYPNPINFGDVDLNTPENINTKCNDDEDCPIDQVCHLDFISGLEKYCYAKKTITVYNYANDPVAVERLGLVGDSCNDFYIDPANTLEKHECFEANGNDDCQDTMMCELLEEGGSLRYCHIPPGGGTGQFDMYFRPTVIGENKDCQLSIKNTLPSPGDVMFYDILGNGKLPNKQPLARIALQSHGQPVINKLENILQDTYLTFFGDISIDYDGTLEVFQWTLDLPNGTTEVPNSEHIVEAGNPYTVKVDFTMAGTYKLSLKVQDNDGWWSEIKTVEIEVRGEQGMWLIMNFKASRDGIPILSTSIVDMDLFVIGPKGGKCYDNAISSNNTCQFIVGATAIMPVTTQGAQCCGTREEMRINDPIDGRWIFGATYVEACEDWVNLLVLPFCGSTLKNSSFTIEFWDPNDWESTVPLFEVFTSSIGDGKTVQWSTVRLDGLWQTPVKM